MEAIIDLQTEFICQYSPDLLLTYVNQAYSEWCGLPKYHLIGTEFMDRIPLEERALTLDHIQSLSSDNPTSVYLNQSMLPDGTRILIEWTDRVLFDDNGQLTGYLGVGRDITERERQTQQILELKNQLASILDTIQDAILSITLPDQRVVYASTALEKIFGYPAERFIKDHTLHRSLIHPEDLEDFLQARETAFREGYTKLDHRIIWPDGQVRWVHRRVWVNFDSNGQPANLIDTAQDITERKEAELAREQINQTLQLFVEHAPAAIALFDREMHYLAASRRWYSDYRLPDQDIIGHSHYDIFPELTDRLRLIHRRCLAGAVEKSKAEPFPRADGTVDWVRWEVRPWRNTEGQIGGIIIFSEVITDQKEAEEALQTSEARYRQMFEAHGLPKLIIDPADGQIIDANPAAAKYYGYDLATLKELHISAINQSLSAVVKAKMADASLHRLTAFQFKHRLADGSIRDVEVFSGPLEYDGRQLLYSIITDVTEREKNNAALIRSRQRLEGLHKLDQAINTANSLNSLVQLALIQLTDLIPCYNISATIINQQNPEHSIFGVQSNNANQSKTYLVYRPKLSQIEALRKQPYLLLAETDPQIQELCEEGVRQVLSVGLSHKNTLLGVLSFFATQPDYFTAEVLEIALEIANQLALGFYKIQVTSDLSRANNQLEQRVSERTAELESTKNRLEAIFNHSGDAIFLLSLEEGIQQANPTFKHYFALQPTDYLGKKLHTFFQPNAEIEINSVIQKVAASHQKQEIEARTRTGLEVEISLAPVNRSAKAVTNLVGIIRDITARKQSEARLLALSSRLQLATRAGSIGIWDWDAQKNKLIWDDQMLEFYGLTREEFEGTAVGYWDGRLIHPDDYAQVQGDFAAALAGTKPFDREFRINPKTGGQRYLKGMAEVYRDKSGNPVRVIGVNWDISESKRQEEARREGEERFRVAQENSPDGFTIMKGLRNAAGELTGFQVIYNNQAAAGMVGLKREELLGQQYLRGKMEGYHNPLLEEFAAVVETGSIFRRTYEYDYLGHKGWIENTAVKLGDGIAVTARNISQQKQAEEALRISEERFRVAQENSPDSFVVMKCIRDKQDQIDGFEVVYANPAATAMIALEPAAIVGHQFIRGQAEGYYNVALEHYTVLAETGVPYHDKNEFNFPEYQGWVETTAVKLGDGVAVTLRNITQQKEAETRIREAEEMFRTLFETLPDMVLVGDTTGHYINVNTTALKLLGYTREEFLGLTTQDIAIMNPDQLSSLRKIWLEEGHWQDEVELKTKDGRLVPCEVHNALVTLPGSESPRGVIVIRDITERKEAELALRASEERYRRTITSMSEGLVVQNSRGAIELCNVAAEEILGLTTEQMMGRTSIDPRWRSIHEDGSDYPGETHPAMVTLQTGEPCQNVVMGVHKPDGNLTWILINSQPLIDQQGQIYTAITTFTDITARKQTEQNLRESEARYRLLAENIREVIAKTNPAGIRTFITSSCYELTGYTTEELIGQPVSDLVHPNDRFNSLETLQQTIKNGISSFTSIQRIVHKDGHPIWVEINNSVVYHPVTGEPVEIIGIIHDITERKRAEDILHSISQRLKLATEIGGIGVWDWDIQADRLAWDNQMFNLYETSLEEFSGNSDAFWQGGLIHPEDWERLRNEVETALKSLKPLDSEFRMLHQDNSISYIKAKATIFHNEAGVATRILGVNWDITLLKQAEENLKVALEKEKETGELKSRFVSIASHEFRTPLASILAATETLTLYRDRMNTEQINTRLDKIRQQVLHMRDIMNDVLQLAKIQAGRVEYKAVSGDLHALCLEIIEEFENQPQNQGRISYSCPRPMVTLDFDPQLMRGIINNLISNALKYSPGDKTIQVELSQTEEQVTFKVIDQGIGIPAEDLKHLFEPFYRATNIGNISGTGLGLNIARQSVEMHGGTVIAESESGHGTTFTVTLPILPPATDI